MRLRLSKRFYAALMAAIASVTFTFSVQQAAAAEQVDASASSETETAMAVEASGDKEASEAEESEEIEEEEENREPDSAPEVSVSFNGIIGSSDAFDFLGDIENVGNLDNASQQQAGAQSASSSASLPSDDLGFTTNAYAGSIAEALVDVAAPSVPAAIASELKLTTPAKSTSSGSSSSSSDDYSSVADASTVSGSAWNASYGSHISAPAFRSLSSKAPSNFVAANGTGSSLVIATPAGDSVPLLGATEPPAGWIFSFEHNGTIDYFTKQTSYDLVVGEGETGTITFNNALKGTPLAVEGDFKLSGPAFVIDTNGVQVTFAQAMSNYGTDFTVQDSSTEKTGKITALAPAAFQSLHVESGELVIASQIGVVDQLSVGEAGAILTVTEDAKVILAQQVECHGGTINLNGIVDASNLPNAVAREMNVKFVDQYGNPSASGFLAAGRWALCTGNSSGTVNVDEENAKVLVALSDFPITPVAVPGKPGSFMPYVVLNATDKRLWFQNGGFFESPGNVFQSEGGNTSLLLTHTQESPTVEVNVDVQIREECVVYVAQSTEAKIHLRDEQGDPIGSIGNLYLMNNSTTEISPVMGYDSMIGWVTFVGQNITLKCNDDTPSEYASVEKEVTMNNLIVKPATTASVFANILPCYGYYDGIDHSITYRTGTYTVDGQLTIEDGYTFDFRHRSIWPNWSPVVDYDGQDSTLYFEETLARLTMGEEGSLILNGEASFKASTVTNDSLLKDDGNLETRRIRVIQNEHVTNPDDYDPKWADGWPEELEAALPQVNGTMEITGGARLTALNEKVADGVMNNYTTRNQNFMFTGGTMTVTDEIDDWGTPAENPSGTTVSNQLNQSSVINAKAESNGSLTLDNTNARGVDLNLVYAQEGDIIITHKDQVTADTVQIAAERMVAAVEENSFTQLATNATLTVDTLLQAEGGSTESSVGTASKVKADVVLLEGATLDVSNALGKGGLDLAGSFTIQSGAMLSEDDMLAVGAMEIGDKYDLAFNVTSFNARMDELSMDLQNAIDASDLFGDQFWKGEYYVCYTGSGSLGQSTGNGSNVGTVYLYKATPEPTTGTLSLLALAALAARRRRKG